jgi:FMN-dependent NADH-azoreductase
MRLYEFDGSPLLVRLVATTSQLKSEIDSGEVHSDWTVPELLQYYRDNDIIIDKSDLYNMIKNPPLNKYITNIQADNVVFKGQTEGGEQAPDENKKIVQQMAQSALK